MACMQHVCVSGSTRQLHSMIDIRYMCMPDAHGWTALYGLPCVLPAHGLHVHHMACTALHARPSMVCIRIAWPPSHGLHQTACIACLHGHDLHRRPSSCCSLHVVCIHRTHFYCPRHALRRCMALFQFVDGLRYVAVRCGISVKHLHWYPLWLTHAARCMCIVDEGTNRQGCRQHVVCRYG